MEVRVRIAPSPTGFWHIGNTRTALFNYLFAKRLGGAFVLRIEDTDRARYVPEAVDNIIQALKWLGLNWDEGPEINGPYGPYIQSHRLDIYKKHAQELLDKDLAIKDGEAFRFKTKKAGQTTWKDLIGDKDITFDNSTQEDFIILKSDGYPTYNFANVIDDHYMEITHVIRGHEFISSTPKHIMLYDSFGWGKPRFGHAPLILGSDRSKLSKRHGAKSVLEFKQDGFLPEAIVNYMALLGWTPPSQKEILTMEEMIHEFDINDANVASPIFDFKKLEWMNGEYIRSLSDEELTYRLQEFLVDHPAKDRVGPIVPFIKDRIKKLSDFVPLTHFIYSEPEYDISVFESLKIPDLKSVLGKVSQSLKIVNDDWTSQTFEETFKKLAKELSLTNTQIFQLVRIAISGQLVSPPLFETMDLIGKNEVTGRVQRVAENYPNLSF